MKIKGFEITKTGVDLTMKGTQRCEKLMEFTV